MTSNVRESGSVTDRNQQIIALREQGKTYAELGAIFGLSQSQIGDILAKQSPALTGLGVAKHRADAVVRLRRQRKTLAEIAAALGLSVPAVSTIITKHSPSLTGRRRGYEPVVGEFDRLHRNLKMLLLRREGVTYRAMGKQFRLTASAAQGIVASLERLFTGPQAIRALQSRHALRNLHIVHLRRRRLTYAEIGARVGLSKNAVNYVIESIAPSLSGREMARRDLEVRRASDNRPGRQLFRIHPHLSSRPSRSPLADGQDPSPAPLRAVTALPIGQILPDPSGLHFQGTASEAEDNLLRQSIRRFGVLAPIIVSSAGKGQYVIIDGLRRYQIAVTLGVETLACVIAPGADADTRQRIRFHLESTFKPLTASELERQELRLQAL